MPIILKILFMAYYSQNYAGILGSALHVQMGVCLCLNLIMNKYYNINSSQATSLYLNFWPHPNINTQTLSPTEYHNDVNLQGKVYYYSLEIPFQGEVNWIHNIIVTVACIFFKIFKKKIQISDYYCEHNGWRIIFVGTHGYRSRS